MLGDIHTVIADNGEWLPATHRIYRHDLAGGPLLDLGTYPLALASWVLGAPEQVLAVGQDVPGGEVNGQVSAVLRHAGGAQSTISTTMMADTPTQAVLAGTQATLVIEGPFYTPGDLVLVSAGKDSTLRWTEPAIGHRALYVTAVELRLDDLQVVIAHGGRRSGLECAVLAVAGSDVDGVDGLVLISGADAEAEFVHAPEVPEGGTPLVPCTSKP